jgi:putative hydrolase of the HAD superfamily
VSAVLFDLDRTLIDLERATRLGIDAHLAALGRRADPGSYAKWKRLERVHVKRYLDGHVSLDGQRRDRARAMSGRGLTDAEADAWFTSYRKHMEAELRLFDDTPAVLDHIESVLGVPTGIVTNMETDYQRAKMTATGIPADRFGCFLGVDRLPAPKPHRDAFLSACAALRVDPGRNVVFVGDEPRVDALGAHQAGLRAVWLDRPGAIPSLDPAPPPWIERITSLAQLPALLTRPAPSGPGALGA